MSRLSPNRTKLVPVLALGAVVSWPDQGRAQVQTGVEGKVVDADSAVGLSEAHVEVVDGGRGAVKTDRRGRFRLALVPGSYTVRVFSPLYDGRRFHVTVNEGDRLRVEVPLERSADSVYELVLFAPQETRTEAGVLELRQKASTVSDALSSQEMSRTADSNAAGAVKRVVSATIVDGRYVLVRGLGGRYMTTLLNGAILPSTEPDSQSVPLDLFPTSLLANLTVAKSYSPSAPGTFAGGTLEIETNSYPTAFEFRVSAKTGYNEVTTGRPIPTHPGGSLGPLGFDDGTRRLPAAVPRDRPVLVKPGNLDSAQVEMIGESFANQWSADQRPAAPNMSLAATVGDTTSVAQRRLGYLATASFSRDLAVQRAEIAKVRVGGEYRENMESVTGQESARIGALVNAAYRAGPYQDLSFFGLYTHTGESASILVSGYNESDNSNNESTRLQFIERDLSFAQLRGDHLLAEWQNAQLHWQVNAALTRRDQPDTRDMTYMVAPAADPMADPVYTFKNQPGSGERFFSSLHETRLGGGTDVTMPAGWLTLQAGGFAQLARRDFLARRFRFQVAGTDASVLQIREPEQMLSVEHIGTAFMVEEKTLPEDGYDASLALGAGYAVADAALTESLRVVAGVRYEAADQRLIPGNEFSGVAVKAEKTAQRSDRSFLPAGSVIYRLATAMNLRAAYSYTLARPMFHELAPFLLIDPNRRRTISGQPQLEATRIHNADLRWEWFANETEVFAASLFHKNFLRPIEQVTYDANANATFTNATGAIARGAELEGRVSLGRLSSLLEDLRAQANVSLIQSSIRICSEDERQMGTTREPSLALQLCRRQTNDKRPLQGQSPYVINLGAGYTNDRAGLDLNIYFNVFGARIAEVGFDGLPDVYEQPFRRLDVAASKQLGELQLKLSGTNLLNSQSVLKQGELEIFRQRPGVTVSATLQWSL